MKRNIIFYVCAAALVFASCQKEGPVSEGTELAPSGLDVITATTVSTKTTTQDGVNVLWENGDQIGLYSDEGRYTSAVYTTDIANPSETATFVAEEGPTAQMSGDRYYAIYPASAITQWSSDMSKVGCRGYANIPSSQTATKGGWDKNAGILAASSNTTEFTFNHVSAYIKFTVGAATTPFVSVSVASVGNEVLSDDKVNIYYDADNVIRVAKYATANEKQSSVVTLSNGGNHFEEGTYYIALLPGTFANGLSFSFTDAMGKVVTVTKNGEVVMNPGDVANIGTIGTLQFTKPLELRSVYEENGEKQGVVFWVDPASPTKGMIVSVCSDLPMPWATADAINDLITNNNDYDGNGTADAALGVYPAKNQTSLQNYEVAVKHSSYSADKYPAIAYCASLRENLGGNWRLPSTEESIILYNTYYGKSYDAKVTSKKDGTGTNYLEDTEAQTYKGVFDTALGTIKTGDTLDALSSTDTSLGAGYGCWYWLDEETKPDGGTVAKNAYVVRFGSYCYNNTPKEQSFIYARCVRDVELQ